MIKIFNKDINPVLDFHCNSNLQKEIKEFALNNYKDRKIFKFNGDGRQYCNLNNFNFELTNKIKEYQKECYLNLFNISNFEEEKIYGNFIGVHALNNTLVHLHKDPRNEKGYLHFRLLFLIQKPASGGNPIIENVKLKINTGQAWVNFASEWNHSSVPMKGSKPRITLSMGAYINEKEFKKWNI